MTTKSGQSRPAKPEHTMAALKSLGKMVGGTGIEPVTPTMSRFAALANLLKYKEQPTSKFADCSLYIHWKSGQSRPYRGQRTARPA